MLTVIILYQSVFKCATPIFKHLLKITSVMNDLVNKTETQLNQLKESGYYSWLIEMCFWHVIKSLTVFPTTTATTTNA